MVVGWFKEQRVEVPAEAYRQRFVRSTLKNFEDDLCSGIAKKLSKTSKEMIDRLVSGADGDDLVPVVDNTRRAATLGDLKADPRRPSLDTMFEEVAKLRTIDRLKLPERPAFGCRAAGHRSVPPPRRDGTAQRTASACGLGSARDARDVLLATRAEFLDGLVEGLLIHTVHRIGASAENRVEKEMFEDFRRVRGKTTVLFKLAEAAVDHPDGVVQDVLYPVVGEQTLRDLVKEFKSSGPMFRTVVHTVMRASYSNHYRKMLPLLLDALPFRCNNSAYRPIMDALALLQSNRGKRFQFFAVDDDLPVDGVIKPKWQEIVIETSPNGERRINRINYEICVLQSLRDALRSKEIWVEGADRFRNPDEDLAEQLHREPGRVLCRAESLRRPGALGDRIAAPDERRARAAQQGNVAQSRRENPATRAASAERFTTGSADRAAKSRSHERTHSGAVAGNEPARCPQGNRVAYRLHRCVQDGSLKGSVRTVRKFNADCCSAFMDWELTPT